MDLYKKSSEAVWSVEWSVLLSFENRGSLSWSWSARFLRLESSVALCFFVGGGEGFAVANRCLYGSWIPKLWPRIKSPNPPNGNPTIVIIICTILLISFCELWPKSPFFVALGCFFHALGLLFPISIVILSSRRDAAKLLTWRLAALRFQCNHCQCHRLKRTP